MNFLPQATVVANPLTCRTSCRSCGSEDLSLFLSLGELPLANSFLTVEQLGSPEPRFPLEVYYCNNCALVQLLHVVDPRILFSNYVYRTGTNETIATHNRGLAETAISRLRLSDQDLVVEIASNDGSLLACFRERGVRTLGVEPAKNIAKIARDAGIDTIEEFFNSQTAIDVATGHGLVSAVIANNVLAHVDGTVDFLAGCRQLLRPGGRIIIEVPYLAEMIRRLEYDTIYHEHLCYFSVTALRRLFAEAGLVLEHVDQVEIHGGSLRLWAGNAREGHEDQSVRKLLEEEYKAGLTSFPAYEQFATCVRRHREKLLALLNRLKADGKSVVGYGAPAKGNTMLCYCDINTTFLPYTVDRSPLKLGLYTPGTHIPVVSVDRIFDSNPDYVVILAWNFADEIIETLRPYRERGGRVILPIPEPRVT
jgi:SAM-dependent methyltransferase